MKEKKIIEQALLNRIKFIGDDEQIYTGTPQNLIDEIYEAIEASYTDEEAK